MAEGNFPVGNPGGPQTPKNANIKIEISPYLSFNNIGPTVASLAKALAQGVREALLESVCKNCGPEMTRAATRYIRSEVVPDILKHPNINFYSNPEYRGALGVPDRITLSKLGKFLSQAIRVKVNACGGGSIDRGGLKGLANILGTKGSARFPKNIQVYMDKIVKDAYDLSAFRIGKGQTSGGRRRKWLYEANTGETKVKGYSVFPGPGDPPKDFVDYSRTGTHIMVKGGSYDPEDWRPKPGVDDVIQGIVVKHIPGIIKAAKSKSVISRCLRRSKQQRDKDTKRYANRAIRKARDRAMLGRQITRAVEYVQDKAAEKRLKEAFFQTENFEDLRSNAKAYIRSVLSETVDPETKKFYTRNVISVTLNRLEREAKKLGFPIGEYLIDKILGQSYNPPR